MDKSYLIFYYYLKIYRNKKKLLIKNLLYCYRDISVNGEKIKIFLKSLSDVYVSYTPVVEMCTKKIWKSAQMPNGVFLYLNKLGTRKKKDNIFP